MCGLMMSSAVDSGVARSARSSLKWAMMSESASCEAMVSARCCIANGGDAAFVSAVAGGDDEPASSSSCGGLQGMVRCWWILFIWGVQWHTGGCAHGGQDGVEGGWMRGCGRFDAVVEDSGGLDHDRGVLLLGLDEYLVHGLVLEGLASPLGKFGAGGRPLKRR